MVDGKNQIQLLLVMQNRSVSILFAAGGHCKAPVIVLDKRRQPGVSCFNIRYALQPQFYDKAVLQRLVGAFHSSLGLRGISMDGCNIQRFQNTTELGEFAFMVRMILTEDAVFVRVVGNWPAVLLQMLACRLYVGLGGLCRSKVQRKQSSGGIIDIDQ